MKRLNCILLFLSLSFFSLNLFCQNSYQVISNTSKDGKYHWTEVTNDPSHTRFYTLANGFQVILTENHNEPRIMCLITTKAGSKNDPPTHTGLAHYLEHMLFKGTDQFGTLDYTQEKMLLDQIENLYEVYNSTQDQQQRKSIYHEIDSISGVASKFAIANEYDKMLGNIGSNMTNAFTSFENTTYMENIPSNNLNKFLEIQKERFRNPVLRLFHTELEAVYEEKNRGLDNDNSKLWESIFAGLFIMGRYGVQRLAFYIIPGIAMWYFMFQSGVHATISGVLLAFAIPFGKGGESSLSYKLQHFLHKPVAYFIVPLFALANTGIRLQPGFYNELLSKNSLGIIAGLVIGKPIGILLFAWIAVKTKLSQLPGILNWKHITGAGLLAGIGFTMSIFITLLAFDDKLLVINSKIAILCASLIAAIAGLILIKNIKGPSISEEDDHTLP